MSDRKIVETTVNFGSRKLKALYSLESSKDNFGIPPIKKFLIVPRCEAPENYIAVDVIPVVRDWIREQSTHLWTDLNIETFIRHRFIIADEFHTLMSLRWS